MNLCSGIATPTPGSMEDPVLYRLALAAELPDDAWRTRLQWTTAFVGVTGLDDHFVHLSTAEQVASTAEAHFAGKADVMLLHFSVEAMREEADLDVRWEAVAASGENTPAGSFPHVYGGPIPYACLTSPPALLLLGPDGKHIIPSLGLAALAEAARSAKEDEEDNVSSDDDYGAYDGGGARGMWG